MLSLKLNLVLILMIQSFQKLPHQKHSSNSPLTIHFGRGNAVRASNITTTLTSNLNYEFLYADKVQCV